MNRVSTKSSPFHAVSCKTGVTLDVSLLMVSICQTKGRGLGFFEPVWITGCLITIRRRDDQAKSTENYVEVGPSKYMGWVCVVLEIFLAAGLLGKEVKEGKKLKRKEMPPEGILLAFQHSYESNSRITGGTVTEEKKKC